MVQSVSYCAICTAYKQYARYGPCAHVLARLRALRECVRRSGASGKDWCHGTASRWSWPGSHCRYIDGFKRFHGTNKRFPLNAHANYRRKIDSCNAYAHNAWTTLTQTRRINVMLAKQCTKSAWCFNKNTRWRIMLFTLAVLQLNS